MRHEDASAHDQRHVQRFFLFCARHSQPVGLDRVIKNAVVAAQASRGDQAHQLFHFCRQRAFQIGIVVDVVDTLHQEVIALEDVRILAGACFEKAPGKFAFFRNLLLGENEGGFLVFVGLAFCRCFWILNGTHAQIVAEGARARATPCFYAVCVKAFTTEDTENTEKYGKELDS
jgi:hypothetical protein